MKICAKVALTGSALALIGGSVSMAANVSYRNAVLADGATAYYEFDSASPTDTAGGDNNASIQGSVGTGAGSAVAGLNSAYDFTGGTVRIPDAATFDLGTGDFSLELWFNSESTGRGDLFTYKAGGGDFGVHKNSQGAGTVSEYFNNNPFFNGSASDNAWHHFALSRSGGTSTLYVDGSVVNSAGDGQSLNIANDLLIGANHSGDPTNMAIQFDGQIDEVAWYPSALSEAQIDSHIALANVPEPTTLGLIGLGAIGLLARRRA